MGRGSVVWMVGMEQEKGKNMKRFRFTLVESLVVAALMGFAVAIVAGCRHGRAVPVEPLVSPQNVPQSQDGHVALAKGSDANAAITRAATDGQNLTIEAMQAPQAAPFLMRIQTQFISIQGYTGVLGTFLASAIEADAANRKAVADLQAALEDQRTKANAMLAAQRAQADTDRKAAADALAKAKADAGAALAKVQGDFDKYKGAEAVKDRSRHSWLNAGFYASCLALMLLGMLAATWGGRPWGLAVAAAGLVCAVLVVAVDKYQTPMIIGTLTLVIGGAVYWAIENRFTLTDVVTGFQKAKAQKPAAWEDLKTAIAQNPTTVAIVATIKDKLDMTLPPPAIPTPAAP